MKKKSIIIIISIFVILPILIVILLLPNRTQKITSDNKEAKENKISIEDVKKYYIDREIVNITTFSNYELVESKYKDGNECYEFWNLNDGDRDVLPVGPNHVKLYKIVNPDKIVFLADGRNTLDGYISFPFYIECMRNKEYPNEDGDFYRIDIKRYADINEINEFGGRHVEEKADPGTLIPEYNIAGIKTTFTGIEFLIGPAKGKENAFADGITMPHIKTYFDKDESKFIIELFGTKIDGIKNTKINEGNYFINSIALSSSGDNTIVKIDLKNTARYYIESSKVLKKDNKDDINAPLPILGIDFAEAAEEIEN